MAHTVPVAVGKFALQVRHNAIQEHLCQHRCGGSYGLSGFT